MRIVLLVMVASLAGACVVEEPVGELAGTTESEATEIESAELVASDVPAPEVTLSQCLNACELGSEAIAALCRVILHPAIKEACWRAVNAGPVACANFCYWYFTP